MIYEPERKSKTTENIPRTHDVSELTNLKQITDDQAL